jgi:hypothetical protein
MTNIDALIIENLRKEFESLRKEFEDGDGYSAWEAYQQARRESRPLPDWILSHFDGVAAALLRGDAASSALKLPRQLKGGHGKLKQRATAKRNAKIVAVLYVYLNITRDDLPADAELTAHGREWVTRRFAPLLDGDTELDRVCALLAEDLRRPNSSTLSLLSTPPSSARLEATTIRKIYRDAMRQPGRTAGRPPSARARRSL